ncbi:hypothetical protein PVAP13_8KG222500 [Panicum virgatum]|uniref:Uncharacterized protein n=1 Tax=Panicum virgatum TaxID=38727 RepID=A0A8T0PYM4_PANVG|nr:hypothetical protein PVAP13_8KG222500 [Panicum virgatum]
MEIAPSSEDARHLVGPEPATTGANQEEQHALVVREQVLPRPHCNLDYATICTALAVPERILLGASAAAPRRGVAAAAGPGLLALRPTGSPAHPRRPAAECRAAPDAA